MFYSSQFTVSNLSKDGFTLIELIVVMAIISIMCIVAITGYTGQKDAKALSLGEKQIVNDIRMVQGKSYNLTTDGGTFPEGGYGIRFTKDSNKYMIFADNDNNGKYTVVPSEDYSEIELPGNVKIVNLKKNGSDVLGPVDVVFQPPYGIVLIDGEEKPGGSFVELEIEISNGSNTMTIETSSSRLIK